MRALRWLARWLVRGPDAEHIRTDLDELHARDLERGRTPRQAARHYARNLLGSAASTWRARLRGSAGSRGFGVSRLDFTLGLRMLVKHPGLTGLGGLAMAFAIFVGAGAFEFISQVVTPSLPLPDGDRVVGVRVWDAARSRTESRVLYDLGLWREEVTGLQDVGAFRTLERNLTTPDGAAEPVRAAAMEAAGFRVAGVPPRLGRWLTEEDERPGAAPVVVIGHDIWAERFGGEPDVVGTVVRLGDTPATVVGVMPEGFGFPVAQGMWVPFDAASGGHGPGEGPGVRVVGRLAPDASLDRVRREVRMVGERLARAFPETHEHLRPQVMPWGRAVLGTPAGLSSVALTVIGLASNLPLLLFLVLICGNVALLMFARAAAREGELLVRSALGASRRRLVLQLFTEALVLAGLAAVLGLVAAQYALGWVFRITETIVLEGDPLPFWFHASLSPSTIVYGALLAVLAAAVAGAVPGLKVTRDLAPQLQHASAGAGGFRFGGIWTAVIVTQIVITMVFPLFALLTRAQSDLELVADIDLRSEEYVAAQLRVDPAGAGGGDDGASLEERFAATTTALRERLLATAGVAGVTFTERLPREYHPWRHIEVDGPAAPPPDERGHRIGSASVSVDYFDVLEGEILAGRGFRTSDVDGPLAVVVNQTFVDAVLGGRNAVGQRVRYVASDDGEDGGEEAGPWHEIVGVVEDLGTVNGYGHKGMYHP
ncbi:MAG: ABC transporter permease, partial [Gemmatimonadetes bacterium]|nr:ABC transporter permease [Gemmatimonadota bacterium]